MTKQEMEKWIQKVVAYLKSEEGQAALKESQRRAEAFSADFREKLKVDWRMLHMRVTI